MIAYSTCATCHKSVHYPVYPMDDIKQLPCPGCGDKNPYSTLWVKDSDMDEDDEMTPGQQEWAKNQQKKFEAMSQHEQDMAMLDALEEADKNWQKETKEEIRKYWVAKNPTKAKQYIELNEEADVKWIAQVNCTCGEPNYLEAYDKWDVPVVDDCSACHKSLIVLDDTIESINTIYIPKCLGCEIGLYGHKEGEICLCKKCDKIWCNINQHTQPYGEGSMWNLTSPMPGQILRRLSNFNGSYTDPVSYDIVKEPKNANLISSEVAGTLDHKPVLDIDLPCKLIASTHAGHYHLYIDKAMTWEQYKKLLDVLNDCGIIQPGYRNASHARGFSAVRLPWIKKELKKDEDAG